MVWRTSKPITIKARGRPIVNLVKVMISYGGFQMVTVHHNIYYSVLMGKIIYCLFFVFGFMCLFKESVFITCFRNVYLVSVFACFL